ncbi:PorP/SprF family type IX secretion system membrane protein [Arcticibacter tournemirensis]|nr:PorP/SprF family type IX secretion system membrane protein [Arcticibacter tournemirensis]
MLPLNLKGQQAFSFTQYMNNQVPYNTASSLLDKDGALNLSFRKQWLGVDGAPASVLLSGSFPLVKMRASSGLNIIHDQFGVEQLTSANAFFTKAVRLSEASYLGMSVNAGVKYYRVGYSDLDPFDVKFSDDLRRTTGTAGFGLLLYQPERYYAGISLPEFAISKQNSALKSQNNTLYVSCGYLLGDEDLKIKPAMMVSYTEDLPLLADISTMIYLKEQLGLGGGVRTTGEISGVVTYFFQSNFNLGYSYQTGVGTHTAGPANATHEITLGYRFGYFTRPRFL